MSAGLAIGAERAVFVRAVRRSTDVRLEAVGFATYEASGDEGGRAAAIARALPSARRGEVALGVGGRDAILRYLQVQNVPAWRLRLLMDVEVEDVSEKAGERLAADYRILALPRDVAGEEGDTVLVGLAKEAALLARFEALESAGIKPRAAIPSAVALFDAYAALGFVEEERTTILLDSGPDGAELAIVRSGLLVFARGMPAPREAGGGMGPREAQMLAGAVASSVHVARTQVKLRALPVDAVLVSGAYARSEELLGALRRALKVDVSTFDPLERLDASGLPPDVAAAIDGRGPELALALGLALAREHPRALEVDLTPRPIRESRDFRARTVFLYAAGALLAAALVVSLVTALAAKRAAEERGRALARSVDELEARRSELEARSAANRRTLQVIDALARRTQTGGAALRLISRLREATPPRVAVAELTLDRPPGASAAPAAELPFRIRGEVDDAAGDAIDLLGRFEAALRADPGVASAKVTGTSVAAAGSTLEFAMAVVMRADSRGAED